MDAVDRTTVSRILGRVRSGRPGIVAATGFLVSVRPGTTTLWFIPWGQGSEPERVATFVEAEEAAA